MQTTMIMPLIKISNGSGKYGAYNGEIEGAGLGRFNIRRILVVLLAVNRLVLLASEALRWC